jgi:hypothetical protein
MARKLGRLSQLRRLQLRTHSVFQSTRTPSVPPGCLTSHKITCSITRTTNSYQYDLDPAALVPENVEWGAALAHLINLEDLLLDQVLYV